MTRRIAVLGGGESGVGAAVLAKVKGMDVWLSDFGNIADKYKARLDEYSINWEEAPPHRGAHPCRRRGGEKSGHPRHSAYHPENKG